MVESLQETILEQREELMVSPTGGIPTLRKAHFLKPSVSSIDGPPMKLPSLTPEPAWPLEVVFNGWSDPIKKWKTWVKKMELRYNSVWKKAGIYQAIMASTYIIHDDCNLIFGLAERWCSETNTFIFPWGEATITLEDLLVLGGFSVLGSPVPLDSPELVDIENHYRSFITKNHSQWLIMFMGNGSEREHVAFLSLWLSRFVFPGTEPDQIGNHVFRIAIKLSRGIRLALAPAVLASIYRDMGLLRAALAASAQMEDYDGFFALTLWSPLYYVQVWAWERLPPLHPKPNFIKSGELRLARWKGLNKTNIGNVRQAIDYAAETFLWRPYALAVDNWSIPKFYKEKEEWVLAKDLDCEVESLARCLRVCKLVGMDCEEPYNPHRVAMQFGLDQDLPGWVSRDNGSHEMAWSNFFRPSREDEVLYLPPRLSESDVTTRYLEWWRKTVLCPVTPFKDVVKRQRSFRVPHNRPHKSKQLKTGVEFCPRVQPLIKQEYPDVPPGFPPKCKGIEIKCNEEGSSCNVEPYKMQTGIKQGGQNMQDKLAKGKSVIVEEKSHGIKSVEEISIQNANSESTRILELEARISVLQSELARLKNG